MDAVLGVDIGTTTCKCVVFDERGRPLARHSAGYELHTDETGAAVQDPDEVLHAVFVAIRGAIDSPGVDARQVRVISFSSAMHSLVAIGDDDEPLTPLLTFADSRARGHTERIKADGGIEIYRRTGTPLHPMAPLSKLPWLRATDPDTFARTARFVGIKELVTHRLCGRWVIDHSIASATGMFNLEKLNWDRGALEVAGVDADLLSEPVSTTEVVGELDEATAQELGLATGATVVAGGSDGCLANLGVGAIGPGVSALTIGTSGAVRTVVDRPLIDPDGRTFCYALTEDRWVAGGPVSNGGVVLQWVRDLLAPDVPDAYDTLLEEAAQVEPGAGGLLFQPYLVAERAPNWNAHVRATLTGLRLDHTRAHLTRAALEGVLYGLLSVARVLEQRVSLEGELRATGGFLKSSLWRQMLADVFGRPVMIPSGEDGAPLGAAVLGMVATGMVDSLDAVHEMVTITATQEPNRDLTPVYAGIFEHYLELYDLVEGAFPEITSFSHSEGSE